VSESHLIRPPQDWPVKESWDGAAERLHGITLCQLRLDGRPVWEVARRMNAALDGRDLFSDAPQDEAWLRLLFDDAGLEPTFIVRSTDARVLISRVADDRGLDEAAYARTKTKAADFARDCTAPRRMPVIWPFSGILLHGEPRHCDRGR
jgi:hypothetical protein